MSIPQLKDCYCKLKAKVDALIDKDEQTLSSTNNGPCGATDSVSISNGNTIPIVQSQTKTVYFWDIAGAGVREELWTGAGNSAPHDFPSEIFTGYDHVNGQADVDTIVADWIDNTANDPSNGTDQGQWTGWFYVPADGTQFQDTNANTGELIRIFVGSGTCAPEVVYESTTNTAGGGLQGTAGPFVTLNQGWHFMAFQISDLSAFGGVGIQSDVAGNGVFSNFSGVTSVDQPVHSCKEVPCDYVLVDGESECPLYDELLCHAGPVVEVESEPVAVPLPALAEPIPDNEVDADLRDGDVGVSLLYAREDHKHPIRRQALFTHPDLTYTLTANSTAPQTTNLDRWSDEESISFHYRVRIDAAAETGWNIIRVPVIAGYQQPQISIDGTYRNTGNPQDSMPRAPFMGGEACHWSSTNGVYVGPFNQKTGTGRYYVTLTVKYTRT